MSLYIVEGTIVRILKRAGCVQWLKTYNGSTVSLFKTLCLKSSLTLNMFIQLADSKVLYRGQDSRTVINF
jgi:hypothetical protein